MSRSGYHEDHLDEWESIKWRGQVASAIRGKRGQQCLSAMLSALDAMPNKRLITSELETDEGEVCGLGALGRARGIDMRNLDPEDPDSVAAAFDIATQLAREIVYENDEGSWGGETPEARWQRMRTWVAGHLKPESVPPRTTERATTPESASQPQKNRGTT